MATYLTRNTINLSSTMSPTECHVSSIASIVCFFASHIENNFVEL